MVAPSRVIRLAILLAGVSVASGTSAQPTVAPMSSPLGVTADDCRACHLRTYEEWEQSYHAKSMVASHGGFKKYIIDEEQRKGRPLNRDELLACLGCHAPAMRFASDADFTRLAELVKTDQRDAIAALNVDCVSCHALYASGHPEVKPPAAMADQVYHGTIQNPVAGGHRSQYTVQMGTSEFCKNCHTYMTPSDLKVSAEWDIVCTLTYDSWAEGPLGPAAGANREECQSCHMEKQDGKAAEVSGLQVPIRKVSSHLFPGWHSAPMLERATDLSLATRPGAASGTMELVVTIDNKAGHRIPDT